MPSIAEPYGESCLLSSQTVVIKSRLYFHTETPNCHKIIPINGISGSASHIIIPTIIHKNRSNIINIPIIITIERTTAPITRENILSKNADSCTDKSPPTGAAEIWRNGLNKVFKSSPTEKKSAVRKTPRKLCRTYCNKPLPYHHWKIPTKNILIL